MHLPTDRFHEQFFGLDVSLFNFRKFQLQSYNHGVAMYRFILSFLFFISLSSFASDAPLKLVESITGTYAGKWQIFGIDEGGNIVEKSSWSDELTASNPRIVGQRAIVDVRAVMSFGDGTQRASEFTEGYLINGDGGAGNRFYEINGQFVEYQQLSQHNWSFETVLNSQELQWLGFNPADVLYAVNSTIRTTTYVEGIDTDNVSRVTTVQWKSKGEVKTIQFVSMKGIHKRISN